METIVDTSAFSICFNSSGLENADFTSACIADIKPRAVNALYPSSSSPPLASSNSLNPAACVCAQYEITK